MTREQLWQRVLSRSYVAVLPPPQLQLVRQQFDGVLAKHAAQFAPVPTSADEHACQVARVPQRTEVFVALVRS